MRVVFNCHDYIFICNHIHWHLTLFQLVWFVFFLLMSKYFWALFIVSILCLCKLVVIDIDILKLWCGLFYVHLLEQNITYHLFTYTYSGFLQKWWVFSHLEALRVRCMGMLILLHIFPQILYGREVIRVQGIYTACLVSFALGLNN